MIKTLKNIRAHKYILFWENKFEIFFDEWRFA